MDKDTLVLFLYVIANLTVISFFVRISLRYHSALSRDPRMEILEKDKNMIKRLPTRKMVLETTFFSVITLVVPLVLFGPRVLPACASLTFFVSVWVWCKEVRKFLLKTYGALNCG